ncbi:SAF domain-containing protein [Frankia sp. Cj3]|uniref:SAF domain-containing protein n=1 Tax=Frankia sp. Cj3 TaxID=2880976 RepID=UPI001EF6F805|nr:SAF domain-containing protein [Frankia sp. Cj3]
MTDLRLPHSFQHLAQNPDPYDLPSDVPDRPRGRRRTMAVAALMMVLGASGALWLTADRNTMVDAVMLTRAVQRGTTLEAGDIAIVRVATDGTPVRLASPDLARSSIVGRAALLDLPPGTLITPEMAGSVRIPTGLASVGVRLAPDALPSSTVRAGDSVQVVTTDRTTGKATEVGEPVQVAAVEPVPKGTNSDRTVYLAVPEDIAPIIAGAADSKSGIRLLGVSR